MQRGSGQHNIRKTRPVAQPLRNLGRMIKTLLRPRNIVRMLLSLRKCDQDIAAPCLI